MTEERPRVGESSGREVKQSAVPSTPRPLDPSTRRLEVERPDVPSAPRPPDPPTLPLGRLYLVATPRPGQSEAEFLARVEAALDGGVDTLQLRCKDGEARPYISLVRRVGDLARARNVPFFVNDRVDVAFASGADGVHLGQGDLPPEWTRCLAPALQVGLSTHSPEQATRAILARPAYFAVGPVHATPTKPGRAAAGLAYVRHVAAQFPPVPWYAIGGLDLDTVEEVVAAGATRIAVVRAVLDAPDPAQAAADLLARLPTPRKGAPCR